MGSKTLYNANKYEDKNYVANVFSENDNTYYLVMRM